MKFKKLALTMALGLSIGVLAGVTQAGNIKWTGLGDGSSFTDGNNWAGGSVPANNDYQDDANFGGADPTPTPTTVTLSGSRKIDDIYFLTAGWTLTGGSFSDSGRLRSFGAGINTVETGLTQKYGGDWVVGTGNTLVVGSYYERDSSINKMGDGLLQFTNKIGGYSSGDWGIHIVEGTVRVDADSPYSSGGGKIWIASEEGALELMTDVSSAESLIGSRIGNDIGDDANLQVEDIGDGYVRVTIIPEPASLALLGLGGLCLIRRKK